MCSFHGHGGEIHVHKRHQTPDNKSSLEFPARTFCSEKQEALTFAPFLCFPPQGNLSDNSAQNGQKQER